MPLAFLAGRKPPTLDHRYLVRHVGVRWWVGDRIDPDCGTIWPGLYLRHLCSPKANSKQGFNEPAFLTRAIGGCAVRFNGAKIEDPGGGTGFFKD